MRPVLALAVLLLGCAGLTALGACSLAGSDVRTETLYVDARTEACVGEAEQQCLRVRRDPGAAWERFYDPIEGFDYEPGFSYVLEVEVETISDPPADGSSLAYRLVQIVEKTAAP